MEKKDHIVICSYLTETDGEIVIDGVIVKNATHSGAAIARAAKYVKAKGLHPGDVEFTVVPHANMAILDAAG